MLPAELFCMILGHLHGNTRSLKACSRVAKHWSPTSRHWLFKCMVLPHKKAKSKTRDEDIFWKFYDFLKSTATIAGTIQHLTLRGNIRGFTLRDSTISLFTLHFIVRELPHLRGLVIDDMEVHSRHDDESQPPSSPVTLVRDHHLDYYHFRNVRFVGKTDGEYANTLSHAFQMFSSVRNFRFKKVHAWDTQFVFGEFALGRAGKRHASFAEMAINSYNYYKVYAKTLARSVKLEDLKRLELGGCKAAEIPALGEIIVRCTHLTYLSLDASYLDSGGSFSHFR